MDSETIAELERLEAKATKGPWLHRSDPPTQEQLIGAEYGWVARCMCYEFNEQVENAALIALLRTHVRELLTAAKLSEARGRVCEDAKKLLNAGICCCGKWECESSYSVPVVALRSSLAALAAAEKEPT